MTSAHLQTVRRAARLSALTAGPAKPRFSFWSSMAELGRLSPTVAREVQPVMPADLQRVVSFEWNGPLDQAVAKLSASIGYTFYTTAPANAAPLEVSIRMASVPAYQVFQSLGAEAGTRATVQVDPLHHQVQVIHHV